MMSPYLLILEDMKSKGRTGEYVPRLTTKPLYSNQPFEDILGPWRPTIHSTARKALQSLTDRFTSNERFHKSPDSPMIQRAAPAGLAVPLSELPLLSLIENYGIGRLQRANAILEKTLKYRQHMEHIFGKAIISL